MDRANDRSISVRIPCARRECGARTARARAPPNVQNCNATQHNLDCCVHIVALRGLAWLAVGIA
eukprot:11197167-Lingulodinium_polyedra.AAC.1